MGVRARERGERNGYRVGIVLRDGEVELRKSVHRRKESRSYRFKRVRAKDGKREGHSERERGGGRERAVGLYICRELPNKGE